MVEFVAARSKPFPGRRMTSRTTALAGGELEQFAPFFRGCQRDLVLASTPAQQQLGQRQRQHKRRPPAHSPVGFSPGHDGLWRGETFSNEKLPLARRYTTAKKSYVERASERTDGRTHGQEGERGALLSFREGRSGVPFFWRGVVFSIFSSWFLTVKNSKQQK